MPVETLVDWDNGEQQFKRVIWANTRGIYFAGYEDGEKRIFGSFCHDNDLGGELRILPDDGSFDPAQGEYEATPELLARGEIIKLGFEKEYTIADFADTFNRKGALTVRHVGLEAVKYFGVQVVLN